MNKSTNNRTLRCKVPKSGWALQMCAEQGATDDAAGGFSAVRSRLPFLPHPRRGGVAPVLNINCLLSSESGRIDLSVRL